MVKAEGEKVYTLSGDKIMHTEKNGWLCACTYQWTREVPTHSKEDPHVSHAHRYL